MNKGRFTLIMAMSSYVNPTHVHQARLWDECYCLMSQVIPFGKQMTRALWTHLRGYKFLIVDVVYLKGCCCEDMVS